MTVYTVTAVDTRNAATYIKLVEATDEAAARAHVAKAGFRVDASEAAPSPWLDPAYRAAYGREVEVAA